ncbi:HalOD1 output domain-containing protein [Haloarchaeobius iranensis]|uniref:Halobacterial output domain-containing protein n=1 Tax=Haloarchaeobius iranensis TaxID=996166 RepID=A0A1G9YPA9_9EURY|nr:HalOD1 output domain-containing protein [Haloarchaeobius iranensis]SDN11009.1 hypothetical protein SAMN05192554_11575 [Haloarchaeobius iranensis]
MHEDEHTESKATVQRQFDFEGIDPSMAVVQTLAEATEQPPLQVETLFDYIDPDALDTLLRSSGHGDFEPVTSVVFSIEERTVTVGCDGFVVVAGP